jgi:hypothetical protein
MVALGKLKRRLREIQRAVEKEPDRVLEVIREWLKKP